MAVLWFYLVPAGRCCQRSGGCVAVRGVIAIVCSLVVKIDHPLANSNSRSEGQKQICIYP